jgi:hypothetical protein
MNPLSWGLKVFLEKQALGLSLHPTGALEGWGKRFEGVLKPIQGSTTPGAFLNGAKEKQGFGLSPMPPTFFPCPLLHFHALHHPKLRNILLTYSDQVLLSLAIRGDRILG